MLGVQQRLRQPVVTRSLFHDQFHGSAPMGRRGNASVSGARGRPRTGCGGCTDRCRCRGRTAPSPVAPRASPGRPAGVRALNVSSSVGWITEASLSTTGTPRPHRRSNPPRTPPRRRSDRASSCGNAPALRGSGTSLEDQRGTVVDSIRAQLSPRDRQTGQLTRTLRVISAGQKWCPRQDSNLRSRLRRPVRTRDRRRLPASYLGFVFASCVSGGLLCACGSFHETFHAECPHWTSSRPSCSARSA